VLEGISAGKIASVAAASDGRGGPRRPSARHRAGRAAALGVALSLYDQGDFVLGVWVLLAPVWCIPAAQLAVAFATAVVVHLGINVVGYAIGARRS
jgi:hypothetical protein